MPILVVNGHRIFELDEVGNNLTDYAFAVDKSGETEAEKIAANRVVLAGSEVDISDRQQITGRKYFSNRILEYQPTDIASANDLVLTNGRFFRLTGTTELQTISNYGWTGGSWILLEVKTGQTIRHDYASVGYQRGILLAVQNDYTATQDLILQLVYDRITEKWKEVGGTSIAAIVERPWYTAIKRQASAFQITDTAQIFGSTEGIFAGMTFTNRGTAPITTYDDFILIGAGTVFGLKNEDGTIEIPCCEGNAEELYVHDIVNGYLFYIVGDKTVITQDSYFKSSENGLQKITLLNGNIIYVAYKNNKTPIYV